MQNPKLTLRNLSPFIIVALLFVCSARGASSSSIKPLETFDFYAAPMIGLVSGNYTAGDVDKGSLTGFQYGARLGVKLGTFLLGGEIGSIENIRSSKSSNMKAADEIKYARNKSGPIANLGINLGLDLDRVALWANYYPVSSFNAQYDNAGTKYDNSYSGSAYSAEINFRVWDRLYLGLAAYQFEYSQYTSKSSASSVVDADLDPKLKTTAYGLTISYLFPFSELKKLPQIFPTMK